MSHRILIILQLLTSKEGSKLPFGKLSELYIKEQINYE